jgi:hypothetical protein
MRCKMYRNVQWNAYHPCEQCGIRGEIETGEDGKTSGMKVTGWAHLIADSKPDHPLVEADDDHESPCCSRLPPAGCDCHFF